MQIGGYYIEQKFLYPKLRGLLYTLEFIIRRIKCT